jgi:hypothetical protein
MSEISMAQVPTTEQWIELHLSKLADEERNGKRDAFQVGPYRIRPAEAEYGQFFACWTVEFMGESIPHISKYAACQSVRESLPAYLRKLAQIEADREQLSPASAQTVRHSGRMIDGMMDRLMNDLITGGAV